MEFKGTKGKWIKQKQEIIGDGKFIGFACNYLMDEKIKIEESQANAQLISKAPEMLEMLQWILSGQYVDNSEIEKLIKEATTI